MSVLETCIGVMKSGQGVGTGQWRHDAGSHPSDTQQESKVVGNTIGRGPTQQTPSHSATQPRGDMTRVASISQE